jgi:hypothetical protein
MADVNEIRALKASLRGAIETASTLSTLHPTIEGLDENAEIDGSVIDDLARITAAHAIASNALRGLVKMMMKRRGVGDTVADAAAASE